MGVVVKTAYSMGIDIARRGRSWVASLVFFRLRLCFPPGARLLRCVSRVAEAKV